MENFMVSSKDWRSTDSICVALSGKFDDPFPRIFSTHSEAWFRQLLTARNLLLAERSRKPGSGGIHGGEKGVETSALASGGLRRKIQQADYL